MRFRIPGLGTVVDASDPETHELLASLSELYERNPLQEFEPHLKQRPFFEASTPVQAAFAGNRFGKTTALVVKCFIQHTPDELLPSWLRPYKLARSEPVMGRLLCPSFKVLEGVNLPALRRWAPREILLGGSWEKAWSKEHRVVRFKDGGQLEVFTYEQDADKMGGASLDYVAYDEPPPEAIREECRFRLIDRDGFEMFAMTPVNMSGGGIGWVYRKIWKRREHPGVTVVQGSIHDNPTLPPEAIERALGEFAVDDPERRAREFGEFVHIGGMVYAGGFERVLREPLSPEELRGRDVVVGIDPGLKNAAFVWVAFDADNRIVVFDEVLLQERTPSDYARAIRVTNRKWGLSESNVQFVIDPSARNRPVSGVGQSVEALLHLEGIYPLHGQNDVQAGVQQVRNRIARGGFFVCSNLHGLRSEAEEYRAEDRPDGEFKVVKENDHRLDALRYAVMTRLWQPSADLVEAREDLGAYLQRGEAPPYQDFVGAAPQEFGPLGFMS